MHLFHIKHDPYHDHLRRVPLFARLDRRELDAVARVVTDLRLHAGDVLVRQGSRGRELMFVVSGTVAVDRDGERIAEIGPGGVVGEIAVLARGARTASVVATTDVEVLHVVDRRLDELFAAVPSLARGLLPIVVGRAA